MSGETREQARRNAETMAGAKPQNRRYREVKTEIVGSWRDAVTAVMAGAERVYVVGAAPAAAECAGLAGEIGASVYLDGHWPTLRFAGGASIRCAAQWTGSDSHSIEETRAILDRIGVQIRRRFGSSAVMLATPATTGRDLWLRVAGEQWPVMSAPMQTEIRATSTQGRIELFRPREATAEHLYAWDMRIAYSAVLRGLPIGEPVELGGAAGAALAEANPYARARFRVSWKAPAEWDHVGILPAEGDPRSWPMAGEGWADGAEVRLALVHGWKVNVSRAFVWERSADPLSPWERRITAAIRDAESAGDRPMRHAWRAMLLQAIGAFHGAPRRHTVIGSDPPADAENLRFLDDGIMAWIERRPAAWPSLSHPEWSSMVWARTRARLLSGPGGSGMLSLDPRTVVACRTDAIYTTNDRPASWPDDGAPGRFRLKAHTFKAGRRWPTTSAELLREIEAES